MDVIPVLPKKEWNGKIGKNDAGFQPEVQARFSYLRRRGRVRKWM